MARSRPATPTLQRAALLASPWLFFGAVFAWSWGFWIAMAASGTSLQSAAGKTLELVGLAGPMLGGIIFTWLTQGAAGRRDYFARMVDPRRIPARWLAVVILLPPAIWLASALLDAATGGTATLGLIAETAAPFLAAPAAIVPVVLSILAYGPIPEEPGWRGYALDRLQARWNALTATLVLGCVWALYHVPLFYLAGGIHSDRGPWSAWFFLFMAQVVSAAVVFTWVFNNTRRSTLAAILLHFTMNVGAELANKTDRTNAYATLAWAAAAIVIVAAWGPRALRRNDGRRD